MRKKILQSVEDPFNKMIGANLRYCRVLRKLTMSDIAEVIGVTHQQIYKYENGLNALTIFRLKQFADFYKEQIQNLINPEYISIMCRLVECNFFNTSEENRVLGSVNLASMADLQKNVRVKDYQNSTLHLNFKDHGAFVNEFKIEAINPKGFNTADYEEFADDYPPHVSELENDPKMRATYDAIKKKSEVN